MREDETMTQDAVGDDPTAPTEAEAETQTGPTQTGDGTPPEVLGETEVLRS